MLDMSKLNGLARVMCRSVVSQLHIGAVCGTTIGMCEVCACECGVNFVSFSWHNYNVVCILAFVRGGNVLIYELKASVIPHIVVCAFHLCTNRALYILKYHVCAMFTTFWREVLWIV